MQKTKREKTDVAEDAAEVLQDAVETIEEAQAAVAGNEAEDTPGQEADSAADQPEAATQAEEEALETRLLRLQADFDNFRKRTARERSDWQRQAAENVLHDLLPVVDHYELGLKTARQHQAEQAVLDGFQMVYEQFLAALRKHQVSPIAAEGEEFDHNVHEAITTLPSEEHPAGIIMAETRRGYRIGDKLLRASLVVVSSGPAEAEGDTKE